MVDNSTTPSTGLPVASDDVGGFQYQRIKVTFGPDGSASDVTNSNPFPVSIQTDNSGASTSANQTTVISKLAQFYAEDNPHASGDAGYMALAVRKDTEGALAGTDGDYAPIQVDSLGRLRAVFAAPILPATTDRSGSIATGGTQQTLAAANGSRAGLTIQNTSASELRVKEDGTPATMTSGYSLQPGSTATVNSNKLISIIGLNTGQTWAATEW